MKRRPLAGKIHVCVCSRLDPEGFFRNTADEFLRQGFRGPRKSSKIVLPGLSGLRAKSRSLETLIGAEGEFENDAGEKNGSWTDRDPHRINVPRMDPLGQRYSQPADVVRPSDIENFQYSTLKKEAELVLPPIPQRPPPPPEQDHFGQGQLGVTMLVPDNTPVSTANNERSSRQPDARSRGVNKAGAGRLLRNERSLNNFINQFGEIKEEGSEKQGYEAVLTRDSSHNDTSGRRDDSDGGESRPSGGAPRSTAVCVCPFPEWIEVTPGGDKGQEAVHECRKCGCGAPTIGQETAKEYPGKVDILEVRHEDGVLSPVELEDGRSYARERSTTTTHGKVRNNNSRTNGLQHAESRNSTLGRSVHGFSRDGMTDSLEFRRASIASSLSEISEGAMEQAWREKLAHDANIRDGFVGMESREQSDAPSMTIRSFGHASQQGDEDNEYSPSSTTSPSRKTRFQDTNDDQDSTMPNRKSTKKLSFFQASDGTSIGDEGHFVPGDETNRRRRHRRGGILRHSDPHPGDKSDRTEAPEPTNRAQPEAEIPLDAIAKRAYERALARAQVENHPSDHALLYLRLTEPYKFSYFEPLMKVCPCCKEPVAQKKAKNKKPDGNGKREKKEARKKRPKRFNEMKHIFGSVDVYDYYPGGKYNMQ
ncbi:hypothetical protein LSH36_397g00008 [Paralvinella palmiformis]|uniref:Uncharacterized protein n=1 Tax=Paralvinella palmiformis TaxID=53620 RepID=A0AAD9JCI2_9ANNE|nr:hypothetical protein LSH36_397g00008 [Paralvinella palmiformis]